MARVAAIVLVAAIALILAWPAWASDRIMVHAKYGAATFDACIDHFYGKIPDSMRLGNWRVSDPVVFISDPKIKLFVGEYPLTSQNKNEPVDSAVRLYCDEGIAVQTHFVYSLQEVEL